MKKWNVPVVEELNIAETANGCLPFLVESCITNDAIADAIQGALNNNNNNNNNNGGNENGSETGKGESSTTDTLS